MVHNFRYIDKEQCLAGSAAPDEADDVTWLYSQGIRAIVSLHPLEASALHEIRRLGLVHKCIHIDDFCRPSEEQIDEFLEFVEEQKLLRNKILVHCEAGHGRTGTMLAIYLVSRGMDADIAIVKSDGPETEGQEECVRDYARERKNADV